MSKRDMSEAKLRMYQVEVFMHRDSPEPDLVFIRYSKRKVSQAINSIIKAVTNKFPYCDTVEVYNMDEEYEA